MTITETTADPIARAGAAAAVAAGVLPAAEALTAGTPTAGSTPPPFATAAVARTSGEGAGSGLAVLVGQDLVNALAASPVPGLDVAAAVQPTLDAAAETLGLTLAAAGRLDPSLLVSDIGAFTWVPLLGASGTVVAALAVSDSLLNRPAPVVYADLPVGAPPSGPGESPLQRRGIEMLHGVDMELTVELGRTRISVRDLLALSPGDVLELDRAAGSPADLLVNGRLIARGEVVVVDEDFGLRVTEIVDSTVG